MIGVSILSVIAAFIVISRVGRSYGLETSLDSFLIFIYPLASLTGENLSTSIKKKPQNRNKSFFSPGFSLNCMLLIWNLAAGFISMAFLSMIRQSGHSHWSISFEILGSQWLNLTMLVLTKRDLMISITLKGKKCPKGAVSFWH